MKKEDGSYREYDPEVLGRLQLVQLDILNELNAACK